MRAGKDGIFGGKDEDFFERLEIKIFNLFEPDTAFANTDLAELAFVLFGEIFSFDY